MNKWWLNKFPHTVKLPATDPAIIGIGDIGRWIKEVYPELVQHEFLVGQPGDLVTDWGYEYQYHRADDRRLYVFFENPIIAAHFKLVWV